MARVPTTSSIPAAAMTPSSAAARRHHDRRVGNDRFHFAAGFGLWLGLQTFINVGVNLGLLPTKGLTLPLMSYGGSSIMVTLGWLGVLMRIHHEASAAGRLAVPRRERTQ